MKRRWFRVLAERTESLVIDVRATDIDDAKQRVWSFNPTNGPGIGGTLNVVSQRLEPPSGWRITTVRELDSRIT